MRISPNGSRLSVRSVGSATYRDWNETPFIAKIVDDKNFRRLKGLTWRLRLLKQFPGKKMQNSTQRLLVAISLPSLLIFLIW